MTWPKQKQAQDQRRKRRQKHERAFLFTPEGHLVWSKNSCGLAMIVGEQPTEPLSALDRRVQLRLRFC